MPDLPCIEDGKECKGFYFLLPIDHRYPDYDDTVNWYTGHVVGSSFIMFKVPAFPFALFPVPGTPRQLYDCLANQAPTAIRKSIHAAHSAFDPGADDEDNTALLESRKWRYIQYDFSAVEGIGDLDSKIVYDEAGNKDMLDYDLIEVPLYVDEHNVVTHTQTYLGFRVGTSALGRKTARSTVKKSKLQLKREQAEAKRRAAQAQAPVKGKT